MVLLIFSTIIREYKCINIKKIAITTFLLLFILFPIGLAQIDKVVTLLDFDGHGIASKIIMLNSKDSSRILFSQIIIIIFFSLPQLVYAFYLSFPYFIKYYTKEKITNNAVSIMCTPLSIEKLVLSISMFSFLQGLFMSMINFLVGTLIFIILGFKFLVSFKVLYIILFIECMIFVLLYIADNLIWSTYGKGIVLVILKLIVLIFISSMIPLFTKSNFINIISNYKILLISLLCSIFLSLLSKLAIKKFSKEKYILSIIKNQ